MKDYMKIGQILDLDRFPIKGRLKPYDLVGKELYILKVDKIESSKKKYPGYRITLKVGGIDGYRSIEIFFGIMFE